MWQGTIIHEVFQLPSYWYQLFRVDTTEFRVEKQYFGSHSRQYCLFAHPNEKPKAWIVYWHGGGWRFGSPEQFLATAIPWLRAGYGVVLPSYRRLPRHDYSRIKMDTIAGLVACRQYWFKQSGNAYPKVILLGMSAGGHLATLAGLDDRIVLQAGWSRGQILGVIACGAVLDLSLMQRNVLIRLLAGSPDGSRFREANPLANIGTSAPPFLLIHGTKDGMAPYQAAERFRETYNSKVSDGTIELISLPSGSHLDAGRWMFMETSGDIRKMVFSKIASWLSVA